MTGGRHVRSRSRRAAQIRSATIGFAVIAICAAAIGLIAFRHDDDSPTAAGATTTAISQQSSAAPANTDASGASTSTATATSALSATTTSVAAAAPSKASSTSLTGKIIVIDPGHNGGNSAHSSEINRLVPAGGFEKACDTSGTETNDGYPEHAFTFDVATQAAADLRARGATVFLTRPDDNGVGPCVDARAASGGLHHANVAISIHADGGPADGRGFHVLPPAGCSGCNNDIVAPSAAFATILRDTFRSETPMPTSTYLGTDGIMPRTDLAGINLSTVPKVFIECGNMRNATDAALLKDPSFRKTAAAAIADGITLYLASS